MNIKKLTINDYLKKLQNKEYFSLGMYGDGEWQCIFNAAFGDRFSGNCEGTRYTEELSRKMLESLQFNSQNFFFSAPDTFQRLPEYKKYEVLIDKLTHVEFVEKNVWNTTMANAELYPFIKELLNHDVYFIGNERLKDLTFLNYKAFFTVSYPNCYVDMDKTISAIKEQNKSGVYIFACGIPATLYVQSLHEQISNSWFLDLGSIWDGFVGIGGQRPTRRELYKHSEEWKQWRDKNLQDIYWEKDELPKVNWHGMGSLDINPEL